MNYIIENASPKDKEEILALYNIQKGREFCPWDEHYPTMNEVEFDLSRDSLFIIRDNGQIIAAASIDYDEQVEELECWSKELMPGAEMSRLAVMPEYQNQGIARLLLKHGMTVLKERGYKSIHFLVNKHNIKAIKSYAAIEFNIVGECELFDQPFICYEKQL